MTDSEVVNLEVVRLAPTDVLEGLTRGEIDVQIATAHRYPRSISRARESVMEMATANQETAEACFYALPRDGKIIRGPSARLAEIVAASWQNIRLAARIVSIDDEYVTAQGVCHDLENNVAVSSEVRRRIVNKYGKRYNADMIMTTSNAAASIALRNALFKVVPRSVFEDTFNQIRAVSAGDAETLEARRAALVAWFAERGASDKQVAGLVGRRSVQDITLEDFADLRDIANSVNEGTSLPDILAAAGLEAKAAGKLSAGRHKVKSKRTSPEKPQDAPPGEQQPRERPDAPSDAAPDGEDEGESGQRPPESSPDGVQALLVAQLRALHRQEPEFVTQRLGDEYAISLDEIAAEADAEQLRDIINFVQDALKERSD